ncbi:tRNA(Ile)-lysidine synthase [Marinospirillum celere]|uniref:tRNA(Ile)-lysidine synthase n=1 Tax=Marinospirillum celere TaxID=1122252 RepID=A0A1I1FCK4_9GAMM|nr:tRNA lysidine(34) synthetase TilS [Marinospirillum celere]SFB97107.1 tRNA(Ile)-lysidine synthase [Marinospirillum celere]
MNPLVQQLQQALETFQPAAPLKICVALSGGLDSRVLLEAARQLQRQTQPFQLRALHIHHGLSPQADSWADFCQHLCQQHEIPLTCVKVNPQDQPGASLEARARQARYQVFSEHLQSGELLLQAHHRKDQAETLLLRLLRGAGTQGLSSIPATRPLGQGHLLRPFLTIPRETLEAFAQNHQLQWIEDESNQQDHFDRNYLRLKILPQLTERFPAAEKNLALSAQLASEAQQLHQDLAELDLCKTQTASGDCLDVPAILELPNYRRTNLLRFWLHQRQLPLPGMHLWQPLEQLLIAREDAQPLVEWGETGKRIQARRFQNHLYIEAASHFLPLPKNWQATWNNQPPLTTPCGLINLQLRNTQTGETPSELQVTARQGGEKIRLPNRGTRDVKRLLQERNLPPWQRQQLPFIWHQGQLIAVGDQLLAEGWERF